MLILIDESRRGGAYLLASVAGAEGQVAEIRKALRQFPLRGESQLHFAKEKEARRKILISQMTPLSWSGIVYRTRIERGESEAQARERCLAAACHDVPAVARLVLDSRGEHQDSGDRRVLARFLQGRKAVRAEMTYMHVRSREEPLLWLPDAVAWCAGKGGDWPRRCLPNLHQVRDL
jgi:hypothetical protein